MEAGKWFQFNPAAERIAQTPITAAHVPNQGTAQSGGLPPVVNNGSFTPTGVAIGENGGILVADQSNGVIDRFEANGTFVSQFGSGQISQPNLIATSPSGEDLYVSNNGSGTVEFATFRRMCTFLYSN